MTFRAVSQDALRFTHHVQNYSLPACSQHLNVTSYPKRPLRLASALIDSAFCCLATLAQWMQFSSWHGRIQPRQSLLRS